MHHAEPAPMLTVVPGHRDVVWLAGADRLDFLHRMSAGRITDLTSGQGRPAIVVNDTGHVVDFVSAYNREAGTLLVTSGRGAAGAVTEHLRRYVLYRDDVRVTDASNQVRVFSLLGTDASRVAAALSPSAGDAAAGAWLEEPFADEPLWLLRHTPGGLSGWDLIVPVKNADRLLSRLQTDGMSQSGLESMDRSRIMAGLPAFGAEFSPESPANPLELELRRFVDFDKGCYIGQEVIARLDTYDKIQRRLVRLESESPMEIGDRLLAMDPAALRRGRFQYGIVTTSSDVPHRPLEVSTEATVADTDRRHIALALVPAALAAGSPQVHIEPSALRNEQTGAFEEESRVAPRLAVATLTRLTEDS